MSRMLALGFQWFHLKKSLVDSNVKCRSKIVMIDLRVIRMMIGVAHFSENPMAPKLDAFFERKLLQIETL